MYCTTILPLHQILCLLPEVGFDVECYPSKLELCPSKPPILSSPSVQGKLALSALLLLLMWGFLLSPARKNQLGLPVYDIGIEHAEPLRLSIAFSIGKQSSIISVEHDSLETVRLSLPEDWRRDEVRGSVLSRITSDPPEFGYRKWHLPAGSLVSFRTDIPWKQLTLHNPSGVPLTVRVTTVDLLMGTSETNAILVKDVPVPLP